MQESEQNSRIAVLSVIIEDRAISEKINALLADYGDFVVGRLGIPYRKKGVFVISVVLDAPETQINALTGKIGRLSGVTAKTLFSRY